MSFEGTKGIDQRVIVQRIGAATRLQARNDSLSVLVGLGLTAKVTSEGLAIGEGVEGGLLDAGSVVVETHVLQHHDGGQEQGSGVSESLASDVGSGTVDGLEDGALVTNVTGGGETETTDETGTHVRQNVTVQVGHDKDLVVVGGGVGDDLQA